MRASGAPAAGGGGPRRPGTSRSRRQAPGRRPQPRAPLSAAVRTRRGVAVAALLVVGVVTLAPHVRLYGDQQRHERALVEEIAAREAAVAELRSERAQWEDDAFVAAQARERLNYAYPGETRYVLPATATSTPGAASATTDGGTPAGVGPDGGAAAGVGPDGGAAGGEQGEGTGGDARPWYRDLWEGLGG